MLGGKNPDDNSVIYCFGYGSNLDEHILSVSGPTQSIRQLLIFQTTKFYVANIQPISRVE